MKTAELQKLIEYLREHVGFYKKQLSKMKFSDNENSILGSLRELPIIGKADVVDRYRDFISDELLKYDISFLFSDKFDYIKRYNYKFTDKLNIFVEFTSGTTGIPFMIIKTLDEQIKLGRNMWRLRNQISNVKPGDMFYFQHNTPDEGIYPFPFERESNENMRIEKELNYLMRSNYSWWHMHLHDMEQYYYFIAKNNINKFNESQILKFIENTGSYLLQKEKRKLENCFSCKIVDHYGCKECWMISYTCCFGYHHINESSIFLELIDDEGNVISEANMPGQIVITSLNQYIMPFVRYKTGDVAQYIKGPCSCKSVAQRIKIIPGNDRIIGTKINGQGIFKDITCSLNTNYKLTKYHSIQITQIEKYLFEVNIKNNKENKSNIETAFIKAAKDFMKEPNCKYIFTYNDDVCCDKMFSVKTTN